MKKSSLIWSRLSLIGIILTMTCLSSTQAQVSQLTNAVQAFQQIDSYHIKYHTKAVTIEGDTIPIKTSELWRGRNGYLEHSPGRLFLINQKLSVSIDTNRRIVVVKKHPVGGRLNIPTGISAIDGSQLRLLESEARLDSQVGSEHTYVMYSGHEYWNRLRITIDTTNSSITQYSLALSPSSEILYTEVITSFSLMEINPILTEQFFSHHTILDIEGESIKVQPALSGYQIIY